MNRIILFFLLINTIHAQIRMGDATKVSKSDVDYGVLMDYQKSFIEKRKAKSKFTYVEFGEWIHVKSKELNTLFPEGTSNN